MLRHKYTKKRMKNKYNRKKRTRKRGGVRNPKRRKLSEAREKRNGKTIVKNRRIRR